MKSLRKSFALILIIIGISSLILISTLHVGLAQGGTNESGLISSDTTWTKANSPYSLTGPVAVNQGVTLKIEAGTIVNLNNFYLRVNGTLSAIGSPNEKN
jgi:hypothetical protein